MPVGNLNEQKIVRLARAILDAMDRGTNEVLLPPWQRRVDHIRLVDQIRFDGVSASLKIHPGAADAVTMTAFEANGHMIGEVLRETVGPVAELGQRVSQALPYADQPLHMIPGNKRRSFDEAWFGLGE